MDNSKKWIEKSSKVVYSNKIASIVEHSCYLPSRCVDNLFYSTRMPDWVNVFPVTNDGKVIMVQQHRVARDIVTLEVPAGAMDKGETPYEAALRELEEETGFVPEQLIQLKEVIVNPAIQTNTCYVFIALNCKQLKNTDFDDTEELEVELMDLDQVWHLLKSDVIDNSLNHLSMMLSRDYIKENGLYA